MIRTALIAMVCLATGCGGYVSMSEKFRRSLTAGQPASALKQVNKALGVKSAKKLPKSKSKEVPLLLLERATILQALGDYELSARDFQLADKSLDVLDLTSDTSGKIAKYLFR